METDKTSIRIILHHLDDFRLNLNRKFDYLEPWQIILYTLSVVFFVQWLRKVLKNEDYISTQKWFDDFAKYLPNFRKKIEEKKQKIYKEIEDRFLQSDCRREFYKYLPDRGVSFEDLLNEAANYRTMGNIYFKQTHLCGSKFYDENEDNKLHDLLKKIFELYCYADASFPEVFPSCRKMEAEVIRMLCSLFHGSSSSCGTLTTNANESIILACFAYRNRSLKKGIRKPEMIVGRNAHIGFTKAAKLLGIRITYVGLNKQNVINVGAIKRAIGRETCLIVASAPSFVNGVMDNIEEISKLGLRYHVPVHVDASIGGFIIPFMEQCDYQASNFDFRLSGVTSISVDLHKYACGPVAMSAILYKEPQFLYFQTLTQMNWSGGISVSQTLADSRSGLLIALTWTTLLYNGRLGYVEKAQLVLDACKEFQIKIRENKFVELLGEPFGPVLALKSKNSAIAIHALGVELNELGWTLCFLQNPNALRINITIIQSRSTVLDDFLDDINKCCEKILAKQKDEDVAKLTNINKTNVIYSMSTIFEDFGVANYLPHAFVDAYYVTPNNLSRSTRTLSIEGQKLSHINPPIDSTLLNKSDINFNANELLLKLRKSNSHFLQKNKN